MSYTLIYSLAHFFVSFSLFLMHSSHFPSLTLSLFSLYLSQQLNIHTINYKLFILIFNWIRLPSTLSAHSHLQHYSIYIFIWCIAAPKSMIKKNLKQKRTGNKDFNPIEDTPIKSTIYLQILVDIFDTDPLLLLAFINRISFTYKIIADYAYVDYISNWFKLIIYAIHSTLAHFIVFHSFAKWMLYKRNLIIYDSCILISFRTLSFTKMQHNIQCIYSTK